MRVLQGIGLGGEWGGAVLMAFEYAPKGKRGLFASIPQIGLAIGLCLSSGIVALLASLPEADFLAWGWRIRVFCLSAILVFVGIYIPYASDGDTGIRQGQGGQARRERAIRGDDQKLSENVLLAWARATSTACSSTFWRYFSIGYLVNTLKSPRQTAFARRGARGAGDESRPSRTLARWSDRIGRRQGVCDRLDRHRAVVLRGVLAAQQFGRPIR